MQQVPFPHFALYSHSYHPFPPQSPPISISSYPNPLPTLLSQVLRTSLLTYQGQLSNTPTLSASSTAPKVSPARTQQSVLQAMDVENGENLNVQQTEKEKNKGKLSKLPVQLESSASSHLTQHEGEVQNTHRVSLSDRTRRGKPQLVVAVPEVDVLQTAQLPHFGMNQHEKLQKKEALLVRQVTNWPAKISKAKKESTGSNKRELRMLFS